MLLLRPPAILAVAACAWLGLPQQDRAVQATPSSHAVPAAGLRLPEQLHRLELVAAEGQPHRRWVRAVRDLVEDRFDVDALPSDTPITVWIASDELVAFSLQRPASGAEPWDDSGGSMFAARATRVGSARWYFDDGSSLDGPALSRPVRYQAVSSKLGVRDHPIRRRLKWHAGTDYAAPIGTAVRAFADGRVIKAARNWVAGNFVTIKHDDGSVTKYLHLHERLAHVVDGARVRQGEVIGTVGKTGRVTGPHLHFELHDRRGRPIDPTAALWPASVTADRAVQRVLQEQRSLLATFLADGARDWSALLARSTDGCGRPHAKGGRAGLPPPPALATRAGSRASRAVPPPRRKRLAIARLVFDEAARVRRDPLLRRAVELAAEFSADPTFG